MSTRGLEGPSHAHLHWALVQPMAGVSRRDRRAGMSGMPATRSRRMRRMAVGRAEARSSTARDTRSSHPHRTHLLVYQSDTQTEVHSREEGEGNTLQTPCSPSICTAPTGVMWRETTVSGRRRFGRMIPSKSERTVRIAVLCAPGAADQGSNGTGEGSECEWPVSAQSRRADQGNGFGNGANAHEKGMLVRSRRRCPAIWSATRSASASVGRSAASSTASE